MSLLGSMILIRWVYTLEASLPEAGKMAIFDILYLYRRCFLFVVGNAREVDRCIKLYLRPLNG